MAMLIFFYAVLLQNTEPCYFRDMFMCEIDTVGFCLENVAFYSETSFV